MIRPYHLKKGQNPYWIRTIRTRWHVCKLYPSCAEIKKCKVISWYTFKICSFQNKLNSLGKHSAMMQLLGKSYSSSHLHIGLSGSNASHTSLHNKLVCKTVLSVNTDLTGTLHTRVGVEVLSILVDLALVHTAITQGAAPARHRMRASRCFGTLLSLASDVASLWKHKVNVTLSCLN